MADYKIGQVVETKDGRRGVVRYIGSIPAAAGDFLGLELPEPKGKNDGSVQGHRIFECKPQHGLFVRPTGVARVVTQPPPTPPAQPPKSDASRVSLVKTKLLKPAAKPSTSSTARLSTAPVTSSAAARNISGSGINVPPTSSSGAVAPRLSRPSLAKSALTASTSSIRDSPKQKDPTVEVLETKTRHLEKQLLEAKERQKDFDRVVAERNRFESLVQKLQTKFQAFHQEIQDLKSFSKRDQEELELLRRDEQEHETILEMVTLDREMAEEQRDHAEENVKMLRQKLEMMDLELDILKSEKDLITDDMSDDAKQAVEYYRLENENERLRNALLHVKDMMEFKEASLKLRDSELEVEQEFVMKLKNVNIELEAKVSQYKLTIDELREQVDDAKAWEGMIEDLSEKNLLYEDRLAEKESEIRDLENLKELNDELEAHHLEQAKDMRAELDAKEVEVAQQASQIHQHEASIVDQDILITKFRDLVIDLQSKMTDAESSKTMSQEQAKDVTGRFNEVMEMNRRLHSATMSSTEKMITAELQKMQAEEANEELAIVKHYLPASSGLYQNHSIKAYFHAKRIAAKSDLLCSLLMKAEISSAGPMDLDQFLNELFRQGALQQLRHISLTGTRLASAVSTATLSQFNAFSGAYDELCKAEKCIERLIVSLKNDEFVYKDASGVLQRSQQIIGAVASDFHEALAARPEDETISRVSSIRSNLALIEASFSAVESCFETVGIADGDWENGAQQIFERLSRPVNDAAESIVAADKLIRALDTLRENSLYPKFPLGIEDIVQQDEFVARTAHSAHKFAINLCKYIAEYEASDGAPIPAPIITKYMSGIEDVHFPDNELFDVGLVTVKLNFWYEFGSVLMNNVEIEHGPAPWVLKAMEMESKTVDSAEFEATVVAMAAEHRNAMLQIRERDELIETKNLEVTHLRVKEREFASRILELKEKKEEASRLWKEFEAFKQEMRPQLEELFVLKAEQNRRPAYTERPSALEDNDAHQPSQDAAIAAKPIEQKSTSGAFVTLVSALQNENHWLRRRENAETFGNNVKDMLNRVRYQRGVELRRQRMKADNNLAKCLAVRRSIPDYMVIPDTPPSQKTSPFMDVTNLARNRFSSPEQHGVYKSRDWEDIAGEDDSSDDEDYEDFSELDEMTMNTIVERAIWR